MHDTFSQPGVTDTTGELNTHQCWASEKVLVRAQLLGQNVADKRKATTRDGRWDVCTAAAIGRHLLDALSGMHGLGFIHRDVKPANFAITPRNAAVHEGEAAHRPRRAIEPGWHGGAARCCGVL